MKNRKIITLLLYFFIGMQISSHASETNIKLLSGTVLPNIIDKNMTLVKSGNPYIADWDILITTDATLTIQHGVEIQVHKNFSIYVNGNIQALGTEDEPIIFKEYLNDDNWNVIAFYNKNIISNLIHVEIKNAEIYSKDSKISFQNSKFINANKILTLPFIYLINSELVIDNCLIKSNGTGNGIVILNGENIVVSNSYFEDVPDAIEFITVNGGEIKGNIINCISDDCIDLNGSTNIKISGNTIRNADDKGISIGNNDTVKSEHVLIERNVIENCLNGISVKGNSTVEIINNTIYNNSIGVNCYEKTKGSGGGNAFVVNTLFAKVKTPYQADIYSNININYSLCDNKLLKGESNVIGKPEFVDTSNKDFRIQYNSACIDAGNPSLPYDPDSSISDIGAFFHDKNPPKLVINEINYQSSQEFDSGDWIELYNNNPTKVGLSNGYIKDFDSVIYVFPDLPLMEPCEYLILSNDSTKINNLFTPIGIKLLQFDFNLDIDSELKIFDSTGKLIDLVFYKNIEPWPTETNGTGKTLELISPDLDNALALSWRASENLGTPGRKNGTDSLIPFKTVLTSFECIPNPFDKHATIKVSSASKTGAEIKVYNIFGVEVDHIFSGLLDEGINEISVNLSRYPSGMFYCIMTTNGKSSTLILSHIR